MGTNERQLYKYSVSEPDDNVGIIFMETSGQRFNVVAHINRTIDIPAECDRRGNIMADALNIEQYYNPPQPGRAGIKESKMNSIGTGIVYIRKLLWLVRLPFGAWLTISKKSWCRNGQIYKTRPYIKLIRRYDVENW